MTVVGRRRASYERAMANLCKLLALAALLLTSLVMMAAPSAAAGHHDPAAIATEHCLGDEGKMDADGGVPECAMACAAALPAADFADVPRLTAARSPAQPPLFRFLRGINLDIATPPPKRA